MECCVCLRCLPTTYAKIALCYSETEQPNSSSLHQFPQRELQVNDYENRAPGSLLFRMNLIFQTSLCSFPPSCTLLPLPHVIKTSLNFLRGLTCSVIGTASIPFQLHCLALIQDGRVNNEFHVERPCSAGLSCSKGPQRTDRDMGLGRYARGEESHYRTYCSWERCGASVITDW